MIQPNFGYSSSSLRILKRYIAWSQLLQRVIMSKFVMLLSFLYHHGIDGYWMHVLQTAGGTAIPILCMQAS